MFHTDDGVATNEASLHASIVKAINVPNFSKYNGPEQDMLRLVLIFLPRQFIFLYHRVVPLVYNVYLVIMFQPLTNLCIFIEQGMPYSYGYYFYFYYSLASATVLFCSFLFELIFNLDLFFIYSFLLPRQFLSQQRKG